MSNSTLSKPGIDYDLYENVSANLLAQWLKSLETKSSLFWLHYIDSKFSAIGDHEKRANSLESTDGTISDTDGENNEDEDEEFDGSDVFEPRCKSIAHREPDLLVALSENCTLGPVCYFCRLTVRMPRVKSFNNRKKTKLSCSLEKQKIEQVVCIVFTTGIISDVGSSCINKLIKNFMKNVSCRKSIALNHSYLQSQDDPKSSYSRTDVEVVEMDSVPKIKELSINIINSHELFIEKVNPVPTLISGHRIVDLQYVLSWALHLQDEHSKICTFSRLEVVDEVRAGLTSLIVFQCVVCGHRIEKSTENPDNDKSEINYGAVCGTLSTGSTYQHLKNFLGIMDIPCMSYRCFHSIEIQLGDQWKSNLWMSMEKAGKEEKGLAIESGQVDSDRLPWTIVYCDGGCSHRSYEKLLTSEGRELRRALFSLKQIFQEDKDLVHEFVQNDGLSCLIKVGSEADQNYQNYILRALGQVMLYVDGMNGVMEHNLTVQWLYSLISSKFRLVVKTALKLLLVFVEYTDSNCMLLIKAIHIVDYSQGALPYHNIMKLLKDFDSADTELLIYATTLINKILSGVPDQDTYYDQTDALEEQGLEAIIQRYMSKPGTDLDLLQQFQIYETVLQYEDGEDISGTPTRHLDETLRKTLRNRKSVVDNSERRKSRRHSTGNTPVYPGLHRNNNLILQTNQEDDDDQSSSSQSSAINNSQLNGSYKDGNRANEAGITPALKRRRERAERQRSFMKEQESAGFFRECHLREENVENEKGNYTNSLQHRIANGNGYSRNSSRKDLTPLMNVVNKLDTEEKQPWIYSMIPNPDNLDETENTNDNERNVLLQLKKENTVKDLTQKLANQNIQHSPSEENKVNRIGDMSGLISKAKEGLAKSKSKADVLKSPTSETLPKVEMKKSENELRWEELVANFNRSLNLCDMDFTDLASEDEVDILAPVAVANGVPPPPPPLHDLGSSAPPPPPLSNRIAHSIIPPSAPSLPLFGVHLQRTNRCAETKIPIKKNKKTVKLFWKEVRDDPIIHVKLKTGFIWDELCPVNVDTQKLEHLFESRAKDLISKKQQEMNKNKEIIVLDPKRSNAINIGMTKLPPPRSIKTAILKMDATIMNREGIEKLLTMLPTEDERTKIQDAQAANPDLPLGSAEQFLLTLASISELPARLKLWAFKLDFENSEREIAEPLMDLKQGVEVLRVNKTFRGILSTLLSVGNFLNGNEVKGFQIEYLAKVPEVKDTVHKHSLLHHLCHIVMEKFPDATDLYSEIGAITRASKIDFDELALNIHRLETDCKASWDHLKLIAKHDGSTMMKVKMSDFLSDCAERIILLAIIHRRIINRFHKFLLWMGIPLHQISDTKPNEFCRIVSEFALEYRTTRERVLQQLEKKANHRERNKTRGKMITDVGKFRTKEDRADAELRQLLGSDISDVESMQGTLPWRRTRRDGNKSFLSPGNGNLTDGDDEILESLVKTATKGSSNRTAPRERKRTRHADRKSLRRTLKNGLSEEEKKHLSAYIKGY